MHEEHIKKRYYIRTNTPSIGFFPFGLMGLIFILLAFIYGISIFAKNTIQNQIHSLVSNELLLNDLEWVNVNVDGQFVFLTGEGSLEDEQRAIEIAQSVNGDTWIGKRRAPISVNAKFTPPQNTASENQHILNNCPINTCPISEEKEPAILVSDIKKEDTPSNIVESCNMAFKNAMKDKTIGFSISSSDIKTESFLLIDTIAALIKACPSVIYVEGHTDDSGNLDTNMTLSLARAQSVINALVERGVNKDQLIPKGYGPTRPRAENTNQKAQALNRRIEFHILNEGETP